jgi:hypothetical protein
MPDSGTVIRMTIDHVKLALNEGIPFVVKMADGRKYVVTDRHQIALGPTYIILVDDKDLAHMLPLRTMTGLSYLAAEEK